MYADRIEAYQRNDVMTADRTRLIAMCYNACITNLKISKTRYHEKQYEAKAKSIQKTVDIISELITALDFEKGQEIAKNLEALYSYMLGRINYADIHQDMNALDEVIGILEELSGAWKQVFFKGKEWQVEQNQPFQSPIQPSASAT